MAEEIDLAPDRFPLPGGIARDPLATVLLPVAQSRSPRLLQRIADAVFALAELGEPESLWKGAAEVIRSALDARWVAVRAASEERALLIESGARAAISPAFVAPISDARRRLGDLLVEWADSAVSDESREAATVLASHLGQALDRAYRRQAAAFRAQGAMNALFSLPDLIRGEVETSDVLDAAVSAAREAVTASDPDGAAIASRDAERGRIVVERADSPWSFEAIQSLLDLREVQVALAEGGAIDLQLQPKRSRRRIGLPLFPDGQLVRLQAASLAAESDSEGQGGWLVVLRPIASDWVWREETDLLSRAARLVGSVVRAASLVQQQQFFLDEYAHRVRNNLLTLAQMIQEERAKPLDPTSLPRVQDWLRALLGIYGALEDNDFTKVDLRRLVGHVTGLVLGGWPAVEIEVEPLSLNSPQGTVLGIVVAELLQNVRKHAYPGGRGRVRVSARSEGTRRVVAVEDWGVGLPDDWRPRGKGVRLMRRLLGGVGGSIQFANHPEGGTIATVTLRAHEPSAISRQRSAARRVP